MLPSESPPDTEKQPCLQLQGKFVIALQPSELGPETELGGWRYLVAELGTLMGLWRVPQHPESAQREPISAEQLKSTCTHMRVSMQQYYRPVV